MWTSGGGSRCGRAAAPLPSAERLEKGRKETAGRAAGLPDWAPNRAGESRTQSGNPAGMGGA